MTCCACARERSSPRRIELLSPATGRSQIIFDPNPEIAGLQSGKVERLHWKNALGIETFGDLVLPVGYRQGERYPLIIVQYESRGFLRGGTGDEYPIHPFAGRGYAVLSFNRPREAGLLSGAKLGDDLDKADLVDFADRRSVQSSLETVIGLLVERGLVDRARIGITGVSDGMATVQFGLVNSNLFAAAAVGSPGWEPSYPISVGPTASREFKSEGYPTLLQANPAFWKRISLARNSETVSAPILFQLADDEYLAGLESVMALREAVVPADLLVFPDEHHIKWQPAHRLALYRRSLDWFDYWLRGIRSDADDRRVDLVRWDQMAAERAARGMGTVSGSAPSVQ